MPSPRDILLPAELTDFFFAENDDDEHFPAIFLYTIWPILLVLIYPTLCLVFVIEGVVELVFLSWLKVRRLLRRHRLSSERRPLLAQEDRTERGYHSRAPVTAQYLAIDIDAVDLSTMKDGARVSSLPTRLVQLPVEDLSDVAVLSWRWDFSQPDTSLSNLSLNVAHAIKYAKTHKIRFLFIDIISLDQSLSAEQLIPEVARFGNLYATIPVIAAYDDARLDFSYIMLRPWIFSEIKMMLHNPHKIAYVGHLQQGTYISRSVIHWWVGRVPRSRMGDTNFAEQLRKAWGADFVTPVLELLNGHNTMADIHDFKFILPTLAYVFIAAESLSASDYLLTVALMLSASTYGHVREYVVDGSFLALPYTKFDIKSLVTQKKRRITSMDDYTVNHIEHSEVHEVSTGGEKVATFVYRHERWKKTLVPKYTVTLTPDMEHRVLEMLNLGPESYSRFVACEDERRAYFGDQEIAKNINLEVVEQRL